MLLSSYLDKWWRHKLLKFFVSHPLNQWLTGKKVGKTKIQKFEYLETEKSLLDEIKNIFHNFWRAITWWKIKIWWKIADTSFKNTNFNKHLRTAVSVIRWALNSLKTSIPLLSWKQYIKVRYYNSTDKLGLYETCHIIFPSLQFIEYFF